MRARWQVAGQLAAGLAMVLAVGCGDSAGENDRGVLVPDGSFDGAGGGSSPTVDGGSAGAGGGAELGTGGGGGTNAPSGAGGAGGGAGTGGSAEGVEVPAGLFSNPVDQFVADPNRSAWELVAEPEIDTGALDYGRLAVECYAPSSGCLASGCEVLATCCVNTGTCCKPLDTPPLPPAVDFTACAGIEVESCLGDVFGTTASAFGPSAPVVTNRGLIPNGSSTEEGGLVLGGPSDLATTRVEVDIEFSLPIGCDGSCLESAGVTFSSAAPGSFVDVQLGLLLSGSRNEVLLLIGDTVIRSFDAGADGNVWSLVASPQGRVEVRRNGFTLAIESFEPSTMRAANLVLFGRNLNSDAQSATLRRVAFQSDFCDVANAWESRDAIEVVDGNSQPLSDERFGRAPSLAAGPGPLRMAYALDDAIFWGEVLGVALVEQLTPLPALSASRPHDLGGVGDPELVFDGGMWHLFYTARDSDGIETIGHATAGIGELSFTADLTPSLEATGDEVSLDAPTVFQRDGLWVLIARATLAGGATELRAFYTGDPETGWSRIEGGQLETLTRADDASTAVTDPSLIVHNSGYQLYVSKRSGTRWAVEGFGSDELLVWRSLGESLGPASDDEAFDRLGGRAPDALSQTDQIDLVYEGQNGVTFELGWAVRPAPWDTAPAF